MTKKNIHNKPCEDTFEVVSHITFELDIIRMIRGSAESNERDENLKKARNNKEHVQFWFSQIMINLTLITTAADTDTDDEYDAFAYDGDGGYGDNDDDKIKNKK
ncbi:hypothetical protein DPMN_192066 [Dreissena polymorpha]|uniref:Uncharacterized protein n=1 Tax=Dreissena polymorpha TaxID=45954 RepID=A0A9D4BCE5_DREPO|nr:hypothetical protein DPMN_192066 [Dreissena polymorpha]